MFSSKGTADGIGNNGTSIERLIKVFRSAKGVVQIKIHNILAVFDEYCEQAEKAKEEMVLGICVIHAEGAQQPPKEVSIVIQGVEVLEEIQTVLCAITLLMGIIYSLDLRYPSNLQHTFEVFQKLKLDGQRLAEDV